MVTSQRLKLPLLLIISTVLLTIFYIHHSNYLSSHDASTLNKPSTENTISSKDPASFVLDPIDATACKNVDITWLASDRTYWDGWSTKAMFLESNGNFSTRNIQVTEGVSLCVVVLLGPSPATSVIRAENHLGPADSIVIEAVGNTTIIPMELQQHRHQTNAYFGSVFLRQADTYTLRGQVEYRSYFWEQPIYHAFKPTPFTSANMAMVKPSYKLTLPTCDARNPDHWQGSWMNKTTFQSVYPLDFYGMFGPVQEDHAESERLFVPDHCRMEHISYGQATQCLENKVMHVWGDGNIRRNFKAFASANRWCNDNTTETCVCNDDNDDPTHQLYPWASDPLTPLIINETWHANTKAYFNPVDSITTKNWKKTIKTQVDTYNKEADIVILGFGNDDIPLNGVLPIDFGNALDDLLRYMMTIYPHQTIVVRTPQYFAGGTFGSSSWNSGRSAAFARVVRHVVQRQLDRRVMLWDVYRLGLSENTCVMDGSTYSRKNVVNIENILLWNLLCPVKSLSSPPH